MSFITKRRLASMASASALIATVAVAAVPGATLAATPSATPSYHNGFEKDDGKYYLHGTEMYDVIRVASKSSPIRAASGNWYATAAPGSDVFTRLGGYRNVFPTNGYTTSIDAYVDVTSVGQFEWSSAINTTSTDFDTSHRRDFIFHVGRDAGGPFQVSVSNNSQRNAADGFGPVTITESGWYTFKHTFKNNGGTLSVDMTVTKQGAGTPAGTWNLSDPSDLIGVTVGGNRYGWLVTNSFSALAIDNVTRVRN
jgi:hypothetical protein